MFERQCPKCGKTCSYSGKRGLERANKNGSLCRPCAMSGEGNPGYGRKGELSPLKGRKHTEEARKNMSIVQGGNGELNNKYPGWRSWRNRALKRVNFCEWCFSEDKLEVHHIIPKAKLPQYHDADWNARVMCADCHITCHKQGGY